MKRIRWIPEMSVSSLLSGAAVLVLLAGVADAADDSVKEKVSLCTSCHGEGGVSQTENIPSLAGQPVCTENSIRRRRSKRTA